MATGTAFDTVLWTWMRATTEEGQLIGFGKVVIDRPENRDRNSKQSADHFDASRRQTERTAFTSLVGRPRSDASR
jgi:hypothetical protein